MRDQIAKVSKRIEVLKQDPDHDKQALNMLYEKKRALCNQYYDSKMLQVNEKVYCSIFLS